MTVFTVATRFGVGIIATSRGRAFPYGPGYYWVPANMRHRLEYSRADALAVTDWLNERAAGYLRIRNPMKGCKHPGCLLLAGSGGEYCDDHL